ncbi:MAG: SGNH/GDSL hydrolase family protein, partial [Phycisphaerae bacterium]
MNADSTTDGDDIQPFMNQSAAGDPTRSYQPLNMAAYSFARTGEVIDGRHVPTLFFANLGVSANTMRTWLFHHVGTGGDDRFSSRLNRRALIRRVSLNLGDVSGSGEMRLCTARYLDWNDPVSTQIVSVTQWFDFDTLTSNAYNDFTDLEWSFAAGERFHDIGDIVGLEVNADDVAASILPYATTTSSVTSLPFFDGIPSVGGVVAFDRDTNDGRSAGVTIYQSPPDVVFFGDSISHGASGTGLNQFRPYSGVSGGINPAPGIEELDNNPAKRFAEVTGLDSETVGAGGTPSASWNETFDNLSYVLDRQPRLAICILGTNDYRASSLATSAFGGDGSVLNTFVSNIFTGTIPLLQAAGITPVICGLPPSSKLTAAPWDDQANITAEVIWWNNRIQFECSNAGVIFADIYLPLLDTQTNTIKASYTADGSHLTPAGNLVMATAIGGVVASSAPLQFSISEDITDGTTTPLVINGYDLTGNGRITLSNPNSEIIGTTTGECVAIIVGPGVPALI